MVESLNIDIWSVKSPNELSLVLEDKRKEQSSCGPSKLPSGSVSPKESRASRKIAGGKSKDEDTKSKV